MCMGMDGQVWGICVRKDDDDRQIEQAFRALLEQIAEDPVPPRITELAAELQRRLRVQVGERDPQ